MKPKTANQQHIVSLSAMLTPISEQQKQWAYQCFNVSYATVSRSTLFCLKCGHTQRHDSAATFHVCENCKNKLTLLTNFQIRKSEAHYIAIIDSIENYQVIRMLFVEEFLKKKQKAENFANEVMQHWVDEKGRITTLSKQTYSMSQCFDHWIRTSKLEVRSASHRDTLRSNLIPHAIYPKKILKSVKRNGFRGAFYGMIPHKLFSLILSNPYAETLLKAKQISLLKKCSDKNFNFYWQSIKICIRNNYIVKDASLWFDYIDLLNHFNKDILNSHYVCPENLKREHDRLEKKKKEQDKAIRLAQQKEKAVVQEQEYKEKKSIFFNLHIKSEKIEIVPLKSVEEFVREGEVLHHCVFSNEYHKKDESLILSARQNGQPVETIEVSLEDYTIVQSRGLCNESSKYHNEILKLVQSNMHLIADFNSMRATA